MSNKDTVSSEKKNSVLTPEKITSALSALPRGYLKTAKEILDEKHSKGEIPNTYTTNWICQVKNGHEYNEDVLAVLVQLGTAVVESPYSFLQKGKKKASART